MSTEIVSRGMKEIRESRCQFVSHLHIYLSIYDIYLCSIYVTRKGRIKQNKFLVFCIHILLLASSKVIKERQVKNPLCFRPFPPVRLPLPYYNQKLYSLAPFKFKCIIYYYTWYFYYTFCE